ncbi:MAG: glycosyltransferase family 2 protein [Prevotella sp.]|jgi:GT2 family glycosyltransferase|nr:glycosyltransferase family 2 protein [Prevotella sp.]MCI1282143.1 glycosyltransferase family 2 protein [Prevotella sp.]
MKILAIIVSYNFTPWIDHCIGSLQASEMPVDIMVLDNGSKDETVKILQERYPEVILVENKDNLGFGKANNIGLHYADNGDYEGVFLLNQDAWIDPNVIATLVKTSEEHPDYGILSPVHLTGNGDKIEHGFSDYCGISDLQKLPHTALETVPFIDAAIWYLPIKALREVGFFAPVFYHYGEDKDMSNRMAYYHWKIGYVPTIFGYHDREFRKQTRYSFFRAEQVYHLSEYTNINYSFSKAFAMGVLAVFKKAGIALTKMKIRDAFTYAFMGLKLLLKAEDVTKARELSQHVDLKNYV